MAKTPPKPNPRRTPTESNRTSIIAIVVSAVVVFGLLGALVATLDLGGFLRSDEEPTPDYSANSIAAQQTMVAENPNDPQEVVLLASMMASGGRFPEAIPLYEQAIALAPDDTSIRLDFARSLQVHGYVHDAEAQFAKVLKIEPKNHSAHYYLARLYLDADPPRTDDAIRHLNMVVEIAPESFLADQARSLLDTLKYAPATGTPIASP